MDEAQIQQVRHFNRAVTRRIGVLTDDYLGRGRPLAESRLLFEIGGGADVRELRARLSLDSGYLSRLLRALEGQGLVAVQPSAEDARVRRVTLTRKGQRELGALDTRSQTLASSLLAPLGAAQRERLIAAMAEVERLLRASAVEIAIADPASADAHACIDAYLGELNLLFDGGFDASRSVSADPGELVPPCGAFVIARLDGVAIGCGGLKGTGNGEGEIKRMWVAPSARGLGIAQRLLDALEAQAAIMNLHTLRLDTNRTLTAARALYARNGYREIPRYNDNPYADHWFEKRLDSAA
ncbi:bifunctional helix-turn-helix transcriptional regulator/GNAT family N-acetyltransferase [Pseudoxanthomonas wuyuanensis]|uniref:Transcriptional regulator, MarR family with acetyltransferase activity n=1 Tax=Pseudoxanthomonas wuyuanensis TaxID=1073196 RepID=A0A286CWW4_9GAMM|nr:helix-turn-helix domain-containing GNAT family N-acetyltransferase [Pseudoxanthomonas wuyuanensis]KAF1720892.1 MarR family transcriptional regulator [Pseudoxanthomonas wuyuanensis]SOD50864.1 transcriptional regulator, MarR family with acetyltransferase activity [Pseudoxanthomonas wuyuanensis]